MSEIREMAPDEVEAMIPLARKFFIEGPLPGTFNPEHFTEFWRNSIEAGIGIVFSAWRDGELLGMLGAIRLPSPTTGELELHEMYWFMDPGARSATTGIRMLDAFIEEGRRMGAARVTMVHLCNALGERVGKVLKSRGFVPLEIHYIKEF